MKSLDLKLVLFLLLMPTLVYAHGEEVIIVLGVQLFLLLLFILVISIVRIKTKAKVILSCAYIISLILIWGIMDTMPYRDNMILINNTVIIGPVIVLLITWLKLRARAKTN